MEYPNDIKETQRLTPTELRVLQRASDGMTSKQIGEVLELSKRTVDFHLGNVYEKLGVDNRLQAINKARNLKLLE